MTSDDLRSAAREPGTMSLEVRGLGFRAGGRSLLESVDFSLQARERVVVLGANGAGKSLLLRLCHGLLAPTAGDIRWHGTRPVREAMVFQRPVLLRRSVLDNVLFALAAHGMRGADGRSAARAALARMDIAALSDRPARRLSGGEQQRVALACAAAVSPDVIWMDEPTASLDLVASARVERAIAAIADSGATFVLTTHDIGQARRLGDRVMFMHRGRLIEDRPACSFFAGPLRDEARRFLSGELAEDIDR